MLDINNDYSNILYYDILRNIDDAKKVEFKNGLVNYTIVLSNKTGFAIKDKFEYDDKWKLIDIKTSIIPIDEL